MSVMLVDSVDRQENSDLIRWGVSLLLVVVFHFAAALWLLSREAPVEPNKPPPPAALLDLAPLSNGPQPVSPMPTRPATAPPVPAKPPAPVVPPKPPVKEVKPPAPVVPPMPKLAVPLPAPAPAKPVPPRPRQPKVPPTSTPAPVPPPSGSGTPVYLDPMRAWQIAAIERLEKFKKQSVAASWRGEQGIVGLQLTIDHQGNILYAAVASSSGYSSLDLQAMTMCRLAQHLPPLPAEFKQPRYTFGVSIEFTLY